MDRSLSGQDGTSNGPMAKANSIFNSITEKVSDGLLVAAQRVDEGASQIQAHPPEALASMAPKIGEYGHTAARALERSADYIRDVDLEELKEEAETRVRQHPGKALLIAAGVGFVLGGLMKRRGL